MEEGLALLYGVTTLAFIGVVMGVLMVVAGGCA